MRLVVKRIFLLGIVITVAVSCADAADTAYVTAKGGFFLPNGKGENGSENGLKSFNSGYNAEVAVGFRLVPYAALEAGTGLYRASATVSGESFQSERTVSGVPVTVTAKGLLDLDRAVLYAGAGMGYYFNTMKNRVRFLLTDTVIDESSHGGALGYHLVLGGDYRISEKVALGADFKWFAVKPELELVNEKTGNSARSKWDAGGSVINLGIKYFF